MTTSDYISHLNKIWKLRKLSPLTSLEADFLFFVIHYIYIHDEHPAFLKTKDIADILGISRKSVSEIRNRLMAKSYIRFSDGARVTAYTLLFIDNTKPTKEQKPQLQHSVTQPTISEAKNDRIGIDLTIDTNIITDKILKSESIWIEQICMHKHLTPTALRQYILQFTNTLVCDGTKWKERSDYLRHFNRWLDIELSKNKKNGTTSTTKQQQRQQQIVNRQSADASRLAKLAQAYGLKGSNTAQGDISDTSAHHAGFLPSGSDYPFK